MLEILEQPNKDGWKVLKSTAAPEPYHNLVIPETCRTWPEERLRKLGGAGKIAEAIEIASRRIKDDCLERAQFSVQIGPLAAQNLPHLHYHLYYADELFSEPNLAEMIIAQQGDHLKDLLFLENNSFRIVAGGHRTGQCFLLRQDMEEAPLFNADIAETLSRLINLYARKFKSVEGMPPDFGLELSIRYGHLAFGTIIPILNQIGTLEYMALMTPKVRRWNLLWSHEETARCLRGA